MYYVLIIPCRIGEHLSRGKNRKEIRDLNVCVLVPSNDIRQGHFFGCMHMKQDLLFLFNISFPMKMNIYCLVVPTHTHTHKLVTSKENIGQISLTTCTEERYFKYC